MIEVGCIGFDEIFDGFDAVGGIDVGVHAFSIRSEEFSVWGKFEFFKVLDESN